MEAQASSPRRLQIVGAESGRKEFKEERSGSSRKETAAKEFLPDIKIRLRACRRARSATHRSPRCKWPGKGSRRCRRHRRRRAVSLSAANHSVVTSSGRA